MIQQRRGLVIIQKSGFLLVISTLQLASHSHDNVLLFTSAFLVSIVDAFVTHFHQFFFSFLSWEVAKLLLIRENFFYDLLFYKKDEVSDWLYKKLEIYYNSEKSDPNTLSHISQAAQLFSVWIRTVYEYCRISRLLRPKQMEIMEAEKILKMVRIATSTAQGSGN